MGRRAKAPKGKAEAKRAVGRTLPKSAGSKVRDLEKRLAESQEREKATGDLLHEKNRALTEALEQQTATAEILSVISGSPTDIQPVFDAVLDRALTLCEASNGSLYQLEDGALRHVGVLGSGAITAVGGVLSLESAPGWAVLEKRTVHIEDVLQELHRMAPGVEAGVRHTGVRTVVAVPLLREQTAIGAIFIRRLEVRPFSEKQIRLLQTFADQAVIAIENVRLFKELQTSNSELGVALEQQTATSELLKVIGRSTFDLEPVFETLAENAVRLCDAERGFVHRFDGQVLRIVAGYNMSPDLRTFVEQNPISPGRHSIAARAALERRTIHILDAQDDAELTYGGRAVGGPIRTMLAVPMLRADELLGVMMIYRLEVEPFTESQVALMETFADQAAIAIENVRLFNETKEALERQIATSEILRVISSSPTDVQPVFDAIVQSAVTLCGAVLGAVYRREGDLVHLVGLDRRYPEAEEVRAAYPAPVTSALMSCRAIHENAIIQLPDTETAGALPPEGLRLARLSGFRSVVAVPMRREGDPIGAILVGRPAVGPFPDEQMALLQTFADQAVIAIENVRLFTELEARNTELTATLDRQVATGEVLRAISQAQTDAQPVFEIIAASARRLCGAAYAQVQLCDGDQIHLSALDSVNPEGDAAILAVYPLRVGDGSAGGRAIETRTVTQIPDLLDDRAYRFSGVWEASGLRSLLAVPMLREGVPIGTIGVGRAEPGAFPQTQIDLLQTFADQAVIAIENVRLFTELQTSNRELTTALETQTATSDILRVISRSQTDVQPVFDAIVESAVRLLGAYSGGLTRITGDQIELAALTSTDAAGDAATRARYPEPLQSEGMHAQAIRERAPFNIADALTDPGVPEAEHGRASVRGYRSLVVVPMFRHDDAVGAISVTRREPGGFTDDEIALLQTFADQAVIAIENARLLSELQARTQELTRSVGELQALGEVGQAISSTLDLQTVLRTIVARATQLADADAGVIYEYDEQREVFEPRATERLEDDIVQTLVATPVRKGQGATGRLAEVLKPIQLADVRAPGEQLPVRDALIRAGYRALLAVPLVREDHLIGGLTVFRKTPGAFAAEIVELLKTFATQSSLAIQNARLFREIAQKSRELEVASQHKSEFLASMSHELRTPLNAIIGFSDVLLQGMFGETNEKQTEYLRDILASGQHLLSLINDILDLSKIEAGRMELDLAAFDLPTAIDDAMLLMRERANRRGITLERHVDDRLGEIRADQRKVKQVLLNLLSNAVKFTPEDGRIDVRAAALVDGTVEISVTDTGIGIAPEDQEAVFEEFRQVGKADKKAEGTGLGLTLCRKFVELHSGRIGVESQIGEGSTFTFTLPVRRSE